MSNEATPIYSEGAEPIYNNDFADMAMEGAQAMAIDDEEPVYRSIAPDMAESNQIGFEEEPVYRSIDVGMLGAAPPALGAAPAEGGALFGAAPQPPCKIPGALSAPSHTNLRNLQRRSPRSSFRF